MSPSSENQQVSPEFLESPKLVTYKVDELKSVLRESKNTGFGKKGSI